MDILSDAEDRPRFYIAIRLKYEGKIPFNATVSQMMISKAKIKNSYVSAVAGGQQKSHPAGPDCFFFAFLK